MFKKLRGVGLPYEKQGLIYFTCRNYMDAPPGVQQKINNLCMVAAGEYYPALREAVTTGKTIRRVSMESSLSESTLYRMRRRFYEGWG